MVAIVVVAIVRVTSSSGQSQKLKTNIILENVFKTYSNNY